jgi:hypothetical protein
MRKIIVLLVAVVLGYGLSAGAQDRDSGDCYYNGTNYPEGYEMCQAGTLKRCEDGSWGDIGMCSEDD